MSPPDAAHPPSYTAEEQARISEMLRTPGAALMCPACGAGITVGQPLVGGTVGDYWELTCDGCGRQTIAGWNQVPPERRPS